MGIHTSLSSPHNHVSESDLPVDVHLKVLHHDGEMNRRFNASSTVDDIKTRLGRYGEHPFQYTTKIGRDNKWIINNKVAANDSTMNDLVKENQTRRLDIMLLVKEAGHWLRYTCINCAYTGSVECYQRSKMPSIIWCHKCQYNLPSPQHMINTTSPKHTLQQSLHALHHTLPIIFDEFNHLNIPMPLAHCVISYLIGDVVGITGSDEIKLCHKNVYHYALIRNPFKPYMYEWIPTTVYTCNYNNDEIVLSNPQIGQIRTNNFYKYDTSEWLNKQCVFDDNKRAAIIESEKKCTIFIGCEQIHFEQEIYCNQMRNLNRNPNEIEFEIKTLTGKTISVCLGLHETTLSLKQFVLDHEGIPPEQQRFVSPYGRDMEDYKTLESYGISPGCLVWLVLRLRG